LKTSLTQTERKLSTKNGGRGRYYYPPIQSQGYKSGVLEGTHR